MKGYVATRGFLQKSRNNSKIEKSGEINNPRINHMRSPTYDSESELSRPIFILVDCDM